MSEYRANDVEPQLVFVGGMHRSGTSLISRGIGVLGVSLGPRVADEPMHDNMKGHWEDLDVVSINNRVLDCLDLKWHSVILPNGEVFNRAPLAALRDEATRLIEGRIVESGSWSFKDPRIMRVLPFWTDVFRRVGIVPHLVAVVRTPESVAGSLAVRNGFQHVKSHLMWLAHCFPLADALQEFPYSLIDYDRFLESPRSEFARLAQDLGRAPTGEAVDRFLREFLDPRLRHSVRQRAIEQRSGSAGLSLALYVVLL
ncbi:MAG: hypothetical protein L0H75_09700, partial [Nitrosospira sp.]|nr:hypothetical protein [Nitrosospira sp.]